MKNCENTPIERTPKTILTASFGLQKNHPDSLFNTPKTITKVKKPSYVVSIFFMLLKIPPFLHILLSSSSFAHLQSTQSQNQK